MCKYLLPIVILLAVSGCYTTKKANRQVYKAHEKHEVVVARDVLHSTPSELQRLPGIHNSFKESLLSPEIQW